MLGSGGVNLEASGEIVNPHIQDKIRDVRIRGGQGERHRSATICFPDVPSTSNFGVWLAPIDVTEIERCYAFGRRLDGAPSCEIIKFSYMSQESRGSARPFGGYGRSLYRPTLLGLQCPRGRSRSP